MAVNRRGPGGIPLGGGVPPDVAVKAVTSVKGAQERYGGPPTPFPDTARSLQIWHPWESFFPGATEFRRNIVFPSGAAGDVTPAGLVLQLPQRKQGIIRLVTWAVGNFAITSVVNWAVLIDDMPVQGWENLTFFPGNVPRLTASEDPRIPVPQGSKISIRFTNTDGAAYAQVGAGYYGWHWDEQTAARWAGETT